jgi:iron complex outermembrane receptor protein
VYRLPSINDLYWNPGGNSELSPEQGYSTDLGIKWNIKTSNYQINFSPNIYSRWIDNWIQWQPNGNHWSALNIKKVWSRGIETNTNLITEFSHIKALFNLKTSYNMSTNIELFNENPSSLGKQLTYCPHYKAVFKASFSFKKLHLTYLHNYTGYRFTSSDNSYFLPAFQLGRLFLSSDLKVKKQTVKIFYKLNNLYNVDYQLIINRPMPLINQEIGLNININK